MNNNMTQCQRIVNHLNIYGSITAWEAMQEYGIMRLASRISELRKNGLPIGVEQETSKNRFGDTTHYAKYILIGGQEDESL